MKASGSIASLAAALVAAQAEIRTIGYDSDNPHFKSRFASLAKITETVRPILATHGLAVVQGGYNDVDVQAAVFGVETTLIHTSGEWLSSFVEVPLAKRDPQGAGSAITYGRRYGLSALLSIATDEDDDAHYATHAPKPAAGPSERPAAQRVASPPRTAPASTGTTSAGSFLMPFGEAKGKKLADMDLDKLTGALTWARDKGKFQAFQDAASLVLADVARNDHADDLPF